jgi:riboflavin synthase
LFTGIVEEIGTIRQARPGRLVIQGAGVLSDLRLGDSIAVDGVCLTVVERAERTFAVEVQPETQRRTNLGSLAVGDRVNLERALAVGGRLGGHFVQGHVDGTGRLIELLPDGEGLVAKIAAPQSLMRYIVTKGFIAVNGVSLTVVDVGEAWFTVALIRYTRENVALLDSGVGSRVNLEVDILAKYVESLQAARESQAERNAGAAVTFNLLEQAGFT